MIAALLAASAPQARADEDAERAAAIAGAVLILGTAALMHHEGHYEDGRSYDDPDKVAAFERGYRDGLHNAPYDAGRHSGAYGDGYSAGMNEREHRLAPLYHGGEGPNAPTLAMNACVHEAADRWNLNRHDVHVTKTRQSGSDDFFVEVAAGKHRATCEVGATGNTYQMQKGRL
jgi:hypothetical protein